MKLAFTLFLLAGVLGSLQPASAQETAPAPVPQLPSQVVPEPQQTMTVTRRGEFPIAAGPADHFTGTVRVETLFDVKPPARAYAVSVTFAPGARTAWHSHPLGQFLIVTAGSGLVQQWGGPIQEIHPGDVVWIPANQKHWHGAGPASSMTHIAISERSGGNGALWMEQVSDEQYRGKR